jgi:Protein of unknown function (DUF1360)
VELQSEQQRKQDVRNSGNLVDQAVEKIDAITEEIKSGYGAENVPLGSYALLMGTYAAAFSTLYYLSTRNGREIAKPKGLDLALLTVASYKLSRVVTMSFIGSPIRAAFTERGESLKGGEVQDKARGEGLQRAIGNLVTCPFCFSVWATTGLFFGYNFAKRATIQASYILSIAAVDDFLNLSYRSLREKCP